MSWLTSVTDWAKDAFSPTGGGTQFLSTAGQVAGSIAAGNVLKNTGGVGVGVNPYQAGYNSAFVPPNVVNNNDNLLMYGALALGGVILLKTLKIF